MRIAGEIGAAEGGRSEYLAVSVAGQAFGIPIESVRDVFVPAAITRVPLASPEVAGVLNLRGSIVTAICLRRRLGLPAPDEGREPMAVSIDAEGGSFALLVDKVGEVIGLDGSTYEANPPNLDARWAGVATGLHRLERVIMVVLDIDRVLAIGAEARAA